jgi:Nif-specific regulatory protein
MPVQNKFPSAQTGAQEVRVMSERTHLMEAELDTLYLISQILNSTYDLHAKLQAVLEMLHKRSGMRSGIITLRKIENNSMIVSVVHSDGAGKLNQPVRYNPGEGLRGAILDEGSTIVVEKVSEDPRFLGSMGLYDPDTKKVHLAAPLPSVKAVLN